MSVSSASAFFVCEEKETLQSYRKQREKRAHERAGAGRGGPQVIVVAEGAGQKYVQGNGNKDASGNKQLADVGLWLASQIKALGVFTRPNCPVKRGQGCPQTPLDSAPFRAPPPPPPCPPHDNPSDGPRPVFKTTRTNAKRFPKALGSGCA
eukprot:1195690-Prorocentrum_minimum.AAC.1